VSNGATTIGNAAASRSAQLWLAGANQQKNDRDK
jgi:hypothetical protein